MKFLIQKDPGLYQIHQVPADFREVGILAGYRNPNSTAKECLLSIFKSNNETLNFWTHIIPSIWFFWQLISAWNELDFLHNPYAQPMFMYIITVCIVPTVSAVVHVFNTMSESARHVCFFVDYSAVSLYSLGSAVAYRAYIFPTELLRTPFAHVYLYVATVNAIVCVYLSCRTRFMTNGLIIKTIRVGAFVWPYIFDNFPLLYRIMYSQPEENATPAIYFHIRQFVFGSLATFLYSSHLPERFFPGRFNIIGHSHQLFHIAGMLATWDQWTAIATDLRLRKHYLLHVDHDIPDPSVSVLLMTIMVVTSLTIVGYYAACLYSPDSSGQSPGSHIIQSSSGKQQSKVKEKGPVKKRFILNDTNGIVNGMSTTLKSRST